MIKCTKGQVRRLKTALRWKIPPEQRQRIQMVLLRESGMTQPLIAAAMGVSLSTVNRAHMAYDHGGLEALKPRPSGGRKRENMTLEEEKADLPLILWTPDQAAWRSACSGVIYPRAECSR